MVGGYGGNRGIRPMEEAHHVRLTAQMLIAQVERYFWARFVYVWPEAFQVGVSLFWTQ